MSRVGSATGTSTLSGPIHASSCRSVCIVDPPLNKIGLRSQMQPKTLIIFPRQPHERARFSQNSPVQARRKAHS